MPGDFSVSPILQVRHLSSIQIVLLAELLSGPKPEAGLLQTVKEVHPSVAHLHLKLLEAGKAVCMSRRVGAEGWMLTAHGERLVHELNLRTNPEVFSGPDPLGLLPKGPGIRETLTNAAIRLGYNPMTLTEKESAHAWAEALFAETQLGESR